MTDALTSNYRWLEAISARRIVLLAILTTAAALIIKPYFGDDVGFGALWFRLAVVGLVMMVCFTVTDLVWASAAPRRLPRLAAQLLGVTIGAFVGTVASGLVIGRSLSQMFTFEPMRLGIVVFTTVAIGIGTIVVMLLVYRERAARAEVEAVRAASLQAALERQVLEARLKLMQAQIEPHFLFNTLATVQHLVNTDAALANRVLASLIRYLRAALPDIRGADSTLAREAELVRAYLEIHAVRMGQRLTFNIDIPVEHARAALPPMMLLTLVENAIKHGIDPSPHGGHISMVAVRDDARQEAVSLIVRVADTGVGIGASSASGVGLANIRTRLTALFGQTASLTLAENTPQGVIAELRVPYTVSCEGQTSGGDPRRFTTDR